MELRRGSELGMAALTHAWNLGYTGYFLPIHFTEEEFSHWVKAGSFDLSRSLILMDGDQPAGFSFLGVRGTRGWVGGFGITPDYRGMGLARQLFSDHVRLMADEGLQSVQLEVLVENWAQKVYAGAGFQVTRRLSILQGRLPSPAEQVELRTAEPEQMLLYSGLLHGEHPPIWQREPQSMRVSMPESTQALCTGPDLAPTGYLLYQAGEDRVRILDGAGGEAEMRQLVQGLAHRCPGLPVSVVNEPEGSPLHRVLTSLGCSEPRAQWEMRWSR